MSNITPILSSILIESRSADPIEASYSSTRRLDSFLQEAYRINSHVSSLLSYLRQIRKPYLSTAPPPRQRPSNASHNTTPTHLTDPQRSEIDQSTSLLLRDLSSNINSLGEAENVRVLTETRILERKYGKPNNFLWRWAAADDAGPEPKSPEQEAEEGKAYTIKTVRGSVLWYLETSLARAADRQREMVEIRVEREREKEKSVLWKLNEGAVSSVNGATHLPRMSVDEEDRKLRYNPATDDATSSIDQQLTPEQLQLFASENSTLLNHYTDTLSKVTQAEKSVLEIASLQQTLVSHLSTQGELIDQLVTDAQNTDENVRRGNKELKKASERGSTAKMVFWGTVGICGFLVTWDLIF